MNPRILAQCQMVLMATRAISMIAKGCVPDENFRSSDIL